MASMSTSEQPKGLRIQNDVRLSKSLVAKPEARGMFLERHDGYGTYWGVVLTPEETEVLREVLNANQSET